MPQEVVAPRRGREGGRWLNERPSSQEFAEWFTSSMKIDEKLSHEDYIGGVVLIPAVDERAKHVAGFSNQGEPIIAQRPELSFIPYAKVETRVAYFWDLLDAHPEWIGVVTPVASPRLSIELTALEEVVETIVEAEGGPPKSITTRKMGQQFGALAQMVHQLPTGFSLSSVPVGNAYTHFLCCTIQVAIYDREEWKSERSNAVPLRSGRGTKQVPLLLGRSQPYADANSLMKAETGALGRALGFAGIFVIPGSGVATAEDMIEAATQGTPPAEAEPANSGPAAPAEAPVRSGAEQAADEEAQLRGRAAQLFRRLSEESPGRATEFGEWMRERGHQSFGEVKGAALRGVVKKLERIADEAAQSAQQAPTEPASGEPSGPAS